MANDLFMTGREVGDFVRNFSISRTNFQNSSEIIDSLINKLNTLRTQALVEESNAYHVFNVKSLTELQTRLDKLNGDEAIKNLTNVAFRETDWGKDVLENQINMREIFDSITVSDTNLIDKEGVANIIGDLMIKYYNSKDKGGSGHQRAGSGKKSLIRESALKNALKRGLEGEKFSKTYARDFRTFLKSLKAEECQIKQTQVEQEVTITLPNIQSNKFPRSIPKSGRLNGYPYFDLTPEDQAYANGNNKVAIWVWDRFKEYMSANSSVGDAIKFCMDKMGRKAFIYSPTAADIFGILGELQTMVFLYVLTNQIISPEHTAQIRKEGKQINIDVLLNNFGFQVKNYRGYQSKSGDQGYHLSDDLSWEDLSEKLKDVSTYEAIKQFYLTQAFNQPNPVYEKKDGQKFVDYESFYENYFKQKGGSINNAINAYLGANIGRFIPLTTYVKLEEQTLPLQSNTVFWVFGGKQIISTSVICGVMIERLTRFKNELEKGEKTTFDSFRVNAIGSYPKTEIWKSPNRQDNVSVDFVEKTLAGLHFDFNIYFPDLAQYIEESKIRA